MNDHFTVNDARKSYLIKTNQDIFFDVEAKLVKAFTMGELHTEIDIDKSVSTEYYIKLKDYLTGLGFNVEQKGMSKNVIKIYI